MQKKSTICLEESKQTTQRINKNSKKFYHEEKCTKKRTENSEKIHTKQKNYEFISNKKIVIIY